MNGSFNPVERGAQIGTLSEMELASQKLADALKDAGGHQSTPMRFRAPFSPERIMI